jgi:hypothetical protein
LVDLNPNVPSILIWLLNISISLLLIYAYFVQSAAASSGMVWQMQGDKQRERCGLSMGGSEVSNAMSCFGTLHSIAMSCHAIQLLVVSTHPKEHICYI